MRLHKQTEKKAFWRRLETAADGGGVPLDEALAMLRFDAAGLLPVITQCADSGEVLMLAWMNAAALKQTLAEERMVYYSRSRGELWRKGDTSGNGQRLCALAADCDGDALLAKVWQDGGGACHTGRRACFYLHFNGGRLVVRA